MKTRYLLIMAIIAASFLWNGRAMSQLPDADKLPLLLGAGNEGMDFWISVPPVLEDEFGTSNYVGIYVTSAFKTPVTVEVPASSYKDSQLTTPYNVTEFRLKTNVAQAYKKAGSEPEVPEFVYSGQGIHITSKDPVIVYTVVKARSNSEGFIAVPVSALGSEYVVSSYMEKSTTQNYPSIATIIAPFDNTEVTFTLGGNQQTQTAGKMTPGSSVTKTLNKGDVWVFSSKGDRSDLSGSKISASKPVSVVSGNQCAYVPSTNLYCHYLAEMQLPTNSWGKTYFASSAPDRRHSSLLRIYAKEPNTTVYRNGNKIAFLPNTGGTQDVGYIETRIADENTNDKSAVIQSDKPIGITLYNPGTTEDGDLFLNSDPFQMSLVPMENYSTEIMFSTPAASGVTAFRQNYINLITALNASGKIPAALEFGEYTGSKWNWTPVKDKFGNQPTETFQGNINGTRYGYLTITLPADGVYRLRSEQPVAAYIFGFSEHESYGYPAAVVLKDLGKQDNLPPVPTWTTDCNGYTSGQVSDVASGLGNVSNLGIIYLHSEGSFNSDLKYPDYAPGNDSKTNWEISVKDKSKEARAVITFSDKNGNDTTIVVSYLPTILKASAFDNDFGIAKKGQDTVLHVSLSNNSKKAVRVSCLEMASGTGRFSVQNPQLPFVMQDNETKDIMVRFHSDATGEFRDTLKAGDSCGCNAAASLFLSVEEPVIEAADFNFGKVKVGQKLTHDFIIRNTGKVNLVIDGYSGPANTDVYQVTGLPAITQATPLTIEPNSSIVFSVAFQPAAITLYPDRIVFFSDATRLDSVVVLGGEGIDPTGVDDEQTAHSAIEIYPNPASSAAYINLPDNQAEAGSIKIIDIFGRAVNGGINNIIAPGSRMVKLDTGTLPAGLYIVEVKAGDKTYNAKLTVIK